MAKTVFFSRNKPSSSNAISICIKYNRTFVGYPALRKGYSNLSSDLLDLRLDWGEFEKEMEDLHDECKTSTYRRQIVTNWNLVQEIEGGCITLIPRPEEGLVYAGRVERFFLCGNPEWAQDYLELRRQQRLSVERPVDYLSDVAQGWTVDAWRKLPFSRVPAWIRKSLFGRSTVARVRSSFGNPHDVLEKLMEGHALPVRRETSDLSEIEQRLVFDIGPSEFEHLVVALLQLEQQDRTWRHVGGSGDGGVDGMGLDANGDACAILQCKWNGGSASRPVGWDKDYYVASLLTDSCAGDDESDYTWSRSEIARLVLKHAQRLPWALSMGVVEPQH